MNNLFQYTINSLSDFLNNDVAIETVFFALIRITNSLRRVVNQKI